MTVRNSRAIFTCPVTAFIETIRHWRMTWIKRAWGAGGVRVTPIYFEIARAALSIMSATSLGCDT
jgi:hypothetical protein